MPSLSSDTASPFVKLMLIGDSGAGKTGALASLAKAGYHIHILDMDNGVKPLAQLLKSDKEALARVSFMSFRDRFKSTPGGMQLVMPAKAYLEATRACEKWEDGTNPFEWGDKHILVLDSLTFLAKAAFNQAVSLSPNTKHPVQWYGSAQTAIENFLGGLMSDDCKTNVIVITHVTQIELADGTLKGFPSAVGTALSRHIGRYFNDLFIVETKGSGANVKRVIRTVPNGFVDAKSSATDLPNELPIDTALETIFKKLKEI